MSIPPSYATISIGRPVEQLTESKPSNEQDYTPIIAITAIFGAIFIFGPLFVRKGPNKGIIRCCIMLTAFCIWIFWVTIVIAQMNPLLGPRVENTTAAWIGYKWGKNPKELGGDTGGNEK